MNNRWQKTCLISIFAIALGLRLVLSFVNRQANDNHLEPIAWILQKHSLPSKEDCWECFQPKAYYLLNAAIIKSFSIGGVNNRIVTLQLVNFLFSFFILLFAWRFIQRQNISYQLKLAAFALVALNPSLAAINVQATNDTLEILAGVGAIYFLVLFVENKRLRSASWMTAFAILASIVKSSGLVIAFSIFAIFILKFLFGFRVAETKSSLLKPFFLFLSSFILIVPFAGGFYQNYLEYKTPFVTNIPKADTALSFSNDIETFRPGITSIAHSYLTFRIGEMVKQPYIKNDPSPYVIHRTSLWSQLYGRTFFLHFDQYPVTWESLNPTLLNAGRIMLVLGLFPLAFFLIGYWQTVFGFIKNLAGRKAGYFSNGTDWLHLVFASAFFLFIIKYTWDYRDFSTMKSIFLFPAIPSFVALFIKGISRIKSAALLKTCLALICLQVVLSIYDISFLVTQLW
jgi:hypothetical protein